MCLGVPMQVEAIVPGSAIAHCRASNSTDTREVALALLAAPASVGDWLLVHIDTAIASISADEAKLLTDALSAVAAAQSGQPFDHLFSDLVDREPQLPDHLKPQTSKTSDREAV